MGLLVGQILFGVPFLVIGALCWTGVWRFWTRKAFAWMWIGLMPLLGLGMIVAAPAQVLDPPAEYYFTAPGLVLILVGLYVGVERPEWYGPGWYKDMIRRNEDWAGLMARREHGGDRE